MSLVEICGADIQTEAVPSFVSEGVKGRQGMEPA